MGWPLFALGIVIAVTAAVWISDVRRARARTKRSHRRHRKIIAYQRAWDWLYKRKAQRLTYRPPDRSKKR